MATIDNSRVTKRPFLRTRGLAILVLCLIAFAFLLGQSLSFTDFVGQFGDWQFARFGRYFPALTILLPILIALSCWVIFVWLARRFRKRSGEAIVTGKQRRILLVDASRLVLTLAALAGLGGLAVFGHYLQLPDDTGQRQVVSLQAKDAGSLREGPVKLIDAPGIGPIARYSEGLIFVERTSLFMPVSRTTLLGSTQSSKGPFTLFVEIDSPPGEIDDEALARLARVQGKEHVGHLRTNGLRPEIVQMYRAAGYPVETQSAVLYRSTSSANFGTLIFMVELVVFGFIAMIFGLALRRAQKRASAAAAAEIE